MRENWIEETIFIEVLVVIIVDSKKTYLFFVFQLLPHFTPPRSHLGDICWINRYYSLGIIIHVTVCLN